MARFVANQDLLLLLLNSWFHVEVPANITRFGVILFVAAHRADLFLIVVQIFMCIEISTS